MAPVQLEAFFHVVLSPVLSLLNSNDSTGCEIMLTNRFSVQDARNLIYCDIVLTVNRMENRFRLRQKEKVMASKPKRVARPL